MLKLVKKTLSGRMPTGSSNLCKSRRPTSDARIFLLLPDGLRGTCQFSFHVTWNYRAASPPAEIKKQTSASGLIAKVSLLTLTSSVGRSTD